MYNDDSYGQLTNATKGPSEKKHTFCGGNWSKEAFPQYAY